MSMVFNMVGGGGTKGKKLSELTEGSLISVLEDGKLVPFYVAKHNYEADLNGEGRTLLVRQDLPAARVWDAGNVNALVTSDIDIWLNDDYKELFSSAVKAQMGVTTFEYTAGNGTTTVSSLQRSVFLLSATELGWSASQMNVEGEALPIASLLRIAYLNGVATYSWTRTPAINGTQSAWITVTDGTLTYYNVNSTTASPRPCFTLPATMALNTEPYADGSWGLADEDIWFDTTTATTTAKSGVTYTNGIADLTPAQLHEIAAVISSNPNITKDSSVVYYDKGDVHRKISTGDAADVFIGDATYSIHIIGFNHDDLALRAAYGNPTATGKAGMTFQTVNTLPSAWQMNTSATNTGGWTSCYMRSNYMPYIEERLPDELKSVIKGVDKKTGAGNTSTSLNVTTDKLFLLSPVEVFDEETNTAPGEGFQYAYYKAGNSTVKTSGGSAVMWWLRSPSIVSTEAFRAVNTSGAHTQIVANNSSANARAAFAYCI